MKHDFTWVPARLNAAIFWNDIENLQRELNVPGSLGVSQEIVNAGSATIRGAEIEGRMFLPVEGLSLSGNFGYLDGEYDEVTEDLNRDEMVNEADQRLEIPRLAPKSWGAALDYQFPVEEFTTLSARVGYAHRDKNFFTDSNLGFIDVHDTVDASFSFSSSLFNVAIWSVTMYGSNLLDKASLGGNTPLPDLDPPLFLLFGGDGPGPRPGPTFSPLNKGRILGIQLRIAY